MTIKRTKPLCCLLALAPVPPGVALAEAGNPLTDQFSLSVGTFLVTTSTRVRVDGEAGNGTQIDTERELGLHDANRFRLDGYWRFKKRHKLKVLYFDTQRSAERTIDEDIDAGDTVFPINAKLDSSLETRVAELAYGYDFLQGENYEVGGSIGVHNLRFKLNMSATETSSGQTLQLARAVQADGPLPVLGLHGTYRINDRFYLDGQLQFFKVFFKPYEGRLEDYTASFVWKMFKHGELGIGYNEFVTRLGVDAARFNGDLRWRYGGARLFVTASF